MRGKAKQQAAVADTNWECPEARSGFCSQGLVQHASLQAGREVGTQPGPVCH